ncbi:MAG: hypothetical protein WC554_01040 [Clostridia bacterium]|jgi:hypothetical protein
MNHGNLPERMKTGTQIIINGHVRAVVRAGQDDDDCPLYRLRHPGGLTGNGVWTVDALNQMEAKLHE